MLAANRSAKTVWLLAALELAFASPIAAQPRADAVSWTVIAPQGDLKPGARATVTLRGAVEPGWHVYGLKQADLGPTQLVVSLDKNEIATASGAATGVPPVKKFDPAFKLETSYYEKDFTITVPVKVAARAAAGKQALPVSVRFQTCNGDICHPPKTVKLSAPVSIKAAG